MVEWLEKHESTITVMEATGVYWRPVWHILEGHGELVLANAPDRGSGCRLAARASSRVRAVS